MFAYGYPTSGPHVVDETDLYPGPPPKGGDAMLAALRGMEQTVLTSGEHSDTEGIVLRYGIFYGPDVPHDELFTRLAKWWALPALTGDGIASWIHIDDVAKATADAINKGRGGQIYNIVDDRPQSFGDYVRELSAKLQSATAAADFASAGGAGRVVPGDGVRDDVAAAVQRQGEGRVGLDPYSPVKFGGRFSNVAFRPSPRSLDGRNAAFHAAT